MELCKKFTIQKYQKSPSIKTQIGSSYWEDTMKSSIYWRTFQENKISKIASKRKFVLSMTRNTTVRKHCQNLVFNICKTETNFQTGVTIWTWTLKWTPKKFGSINVNKWVFSEILITSSRWHRVKNFAWLSITVIR